MTFKKKRSFRQPKCSERVQNLRYEFWKQVNNLNVKNLIFIDESGVNLAMVRLYARSLKGSRARGEKPNRRGKNVSILGAISVKKVLASVNLVGSIDGITFEAFIIRKLVPQLWKGACVLMDNYGIHKGEEIEKAIKKAGARLIFLPPYSPDFSPIENFWSKVKSILRTLGATTYSGLQVYEVQ
ncbi:IS630 family transposase [Microcoleus sp. Pol12B4]|uniref:IS630 family transposase n=1 Tax=Microcoleus sp. Pol12B4 TaxID=3055395 RepID=UPI002FD743CF